MSFDPSKCEVISVTKWNPIQDTYNTHSQDLTFVKNGKYLLECPCSWHSQQLPSRPRKKPGKLPTGYYGTELPDLFWSMSRQHGICANDTWPWLEDTGNLLRHHHSRHLGGIQGRAGIGTIERGFWSYLESEYFVYGWGDYVCQKHGCEIMSYTQLTEELEPAPDPGQVFLLVRVSSLHRFWSYKCWTRVLPFVKPAQCKFFWLHTCVEPGWTTASSSGCTCWACSSQTFWHLTSVTLTFEVGTRPSSCGEQLKIPICTTVTL